MDSTTRWRGLYLTVLVFACCWSIGYQQDSLIFVTNMGELNSRVCCREVLQCVGTGSDVFWTFFGVGSTRLMDTATRYQNSSTQMINGSTVITANLTFDPLSTSHQDLYVCQVEGTLRASTNVRVQVESEPVAIISTTPNTNLSTFTIGLPFTLICQVETCVSDVAVTFYKGSEVLRVTSITNNNNVLTPLSFAHVITIDEDTAGQYGCRAVTSKGGTETVQFTLSGMAMPAPSSTTTTTTTTTTTSTTSASSSSSSTSTSSTSVTASGTVVATDMISPTVSVSPSPGAANALMFEWTLILSLLLVTVVTLLIMT